MSNLSQTEMSRIAVEIPACLPILEHFGLRFYDSIPETLEAACTRAGTPLEPVLEGLRAAQNSSETHRRWDHAPLPALVRFILDNHHSWERQKFLEIRGQSDHVLKEPGDDFLELRQLRDIFEGMSKGFLAHMKREEQELFPTFLHEVAPGAGEAQRAQKAQTLLPLLTVLTREHDVLLSQWDAMKALTGRYTPSEKADENHRSLLKELRELEIYQHQHIHKENFVLFEKIRVIAQGAGEASPQ